MVAGPIRNPATGDWVLLVVRQVYVPGVGLLHAVAELPVPLLSKLLSAVAGIPGLRVSLERRDGQLLLSQPYDEMQIGKQQQAAISQIQAERHHIHGPAGSDRKAQRSVSREPACTTTS